MKNFLCLFLLFHLLCSCGPKEIGEGTSYEPDSSPRESVAADMMRLPMTGANKTEHMLYYYNKPEVMENVGNVRKSQFLRKMGIKPDPEDPEYRAMPQQLSPFRQ